MSLSTHVLDTTKGKPAAGLNVELYHCVDKEWQSISSETTSSDGRCSKRTLTSASWPATYKLVFQTGDYYAAQNTTTFYPYVEIVFTCSSNTDHYHVPLLLSPFGYSTYRGS